MADSDDRDKKYPLFPLLSEAGKEEAQQLMDEFKAKMKKVADEVLSNLYVETVMYIESDSWTNFRNDLIEAYKGYPNRKIQGAADFKEIRQAILRDNLDEIISDLNQDLVEENESLKKQLEDEREFNRHRH